MTLRSARIAPDFTADTTQGRIRFHEWLGNSWGILFSHPKDFTPVCTTELGYLAKLQPEFDKRNTKIIGLSVDPVEDHTRWLKDVESHGGAQVNYPIIGDEDLQCLQALRHASAEEEQRLRAHGGDQPDRPHRLSHWPRQADQGHPQLSDVDRAQLR